MGKEPCSQTMDSPWTGIEPWKDIKDMPESPIVRSFELLEFKPIDDNGDWLKVVWPMFTVGLEEEEPEPYETGWD